MRTGGEDEVEEKPSNVRRIKKKKSKLFIKVLLPSEKCRSETHGISGSSGPRVITARIRKENLEGAQAPAARLTKRKLCRNMIGEERLYLRQNMNPSTRFSATEESSQRTEVKILTLIVKKAE